MQATQPRTIASLKPNDRLITSIVQGYASAAQWYGRAEGEVIDYHSSDRHGLEVWCEDIDVRDIDLDFSADAYAIIRSRVDDFLTSAMPYLLGSAFLNCLENQSCPDDIIVDWEVNSDEFLSADRLGASLYHCSNRYQRNPIDRWRYVHPSMQYDVNRLASGTDSIRMLYNEGESEIEIDS
jgi:hypothetical protein